MKKGNDAKTSGTLLTGRSVNNGEMQMSNTSVLSVNGSIWMAGIAVVAVIFLIFKMYNLHPYSSDESIYICQGKLVADGFTPYKDFKMAHPPLQTLFIALLFKTVGYDFTFFRILPALWTLLGGIILAIVVRRELGSIASVFSMAFYILAYEPMRASIHFTAVNMTIALLMCALLSQRSKSLLLCAIFSVFAVFTRLYALPAFLALLIFTWLHDKREAYKLTGYGLTAGLFLFLLMGVWTGFSDFINNVFMFQAQKTSMRSEQVAFMRDGVLFHNAIPLVMFILGTLTALIYFFKKSVNNDSIRKAKKQKQTAVANEDISLVWFSASTVIFMLMILLNLKRVWMYYYVLAFPFAAIASGYMISVWVRYFSSILMKPRSQTPAAHYSPYWTIGSLVIFFAVYMVSHKLERRLDYYKEAMRDPAKRKAYYTWVDGRLPGFVNKAIKNIFWEEERTVGNTYSSFTYYLWHSSRVLDITDELLTEVDSRSSEDDKIFGDSGTVPLLSLLGNRGIANNEIDTNIEQFRSGNINAKELVQKIDIPSTRLVILRDKFGVATVPEIQNMINRNYREVKALKSKTGFTIRVFERLPA